jgi:hypothetical protein
VFILGPSHHVYVRSCCSAQATHAAAAAACCLLPAACCCCLLLLLPAVHSEQAGSKADGQLCPLIGRFASHASLTADADHVVCACTSRAFRSRSATGCAAYETPFGPLPVDTELLAALGATGHFQSMSKEVDEAEHSLELHLRASRYETQRNAAQATPHDTNAQTNSMHSAVAPHRCCCATVPFCDWRADNVLTTC